MIKSTFYAAATGLAILAAPVAAQELPTTWEVLRDSQNCDPDHWVKGDNWWSNRTCDRPKRGRTDTAEPVEVFPCSECEPQPENGEFVQDN